MTPFAAVAKSRDAGSPPDTRRPIYCRPSSACRRKNHLFGGYQPALTVLAAARGIGHRRVDRRRRGGHARQDLQIAARERSKAGTSRAAQRIIIHGRSRGARPYIRFIQYGLQRPNGLWQSPTGAVSQPGWRAVRSARRRTIRREACRSRCRWMNLHRWCPHSTLKRVGQRHPGHMRRPTRSPHHRGSRPALLPLRPTRHRCARRSAPWMNTDH